MLHRYTLALFLFSACTSLFAQTTPTASSLDDTLQINEVVVRGYATNHRLLETPASIGLLTAVI